MDRRLLSIALLMARSTAMSVVRAQEQGTSLRTCTHSTESAHAKLRGLVLTHSLRAFFTLLKLFRIIVAR